MATPDEIKENERRLKSIDIEIEEFEFFYETGADEDVWITFASEWLTGLVIVIENILKQRDLLTADQNHRLKVDIRKVRSMRKQIEEKGWTYPEVIDRVALKD
jgi:hypothetical protein